MPTGVRLARTSDIDAIAGVQQRAWRAQFPGLLPGAVLAALDARELADAWGEAIVRPPSPMHRVLVAIDSAASGTDQVPGVDRVVGYSAIGPQDGVNTGEMFDLVIDPASTGHGHGSRLMQAAVDHLRGAGIDTVLTWIPLDDRSRRTFLEAAGWAPDGAFRDIDAAGTVVRQVRLVTSIAPDAGQ